MYLLDKVLQYCGEGTIWYPLDKDLVQVARFKREGDAVVNTVGKSMSPVGRGKVGGAVAGAKQAIIYRRKEK
jgi:hypothetical protein